MTGRGWEDMARGESERARIENERARKRGVVVVCS